MYLKWIKIRKRIKDAKVAKTYLKHKQEKWRAIERSDRNTLMLFLIKLCFSIAGNILRKDRNSRKHQMLRKSREFVCEMKYDLLS